MRSPAGCIAAVTAALAVCTAVSSCHAAAPHAGPAATSSATAAYSASDIAFLQHMIQHYRQGVQLAMMAPKHTDNQALVGLAQQIGGTELAEIQAFEAQLLQWDADPNPDDDGSAASLVDDATVDTLRTLHGSAFDERWLHTMIEQHRTAMSMARNEIEHGQSPDIKGIAQTVLTSQQAGIDRMEQLSGTR